MNKKIAFIGLPTLVILIVLIKIFHFTTIVVWGIGLLLMGAQAIALFFSGYQTLIGYLGLGKHRPETHAEPTSRFAVLVCAHNEEAVVGQIIDNLKHLDYPRDLYDIYVICDNCSDRTAEIVRAAGGAYAMERHDLSKKGKGYGLEWMFERLWELEKTDQRSYDAVVMFDADNLVSKNFLQVINTKLQTGVEAVQAYLDSKNPKDTWVTRSYSFAYWATNRTYQLSREHLGLSAQMGGTGVVVSTRVLKELGWGATSLTEDLEFTQRYILKTGKRVAWAHDAKIYDEKPLTFKASWRQRIRWMQGHADCMFRYAGALLKASIRERKLLYFDSMVYLLQPSRVLISMFMLGFLILSFFGGYFHEFFGNHFLAKAIFGATFNKWLYVAFLLPFYGLPVMGLVLEKRAREILYVPLAYVFSFTWIPITLIGILRHKEKTWSHTQHTRAMGEEELKKLNV